MGLGFGVSFAPKELLCAEGMLFACFPAGCRNQKSTAAKTARSSTDSRSHFPLLCPFFFLLYRSMDLPPSFPLIPL